MRVRREKKFRRRRRVALSLVLLAVLLGILFVFWSWVDAQARAVVVISSVVDAPVVTPAAEAVSGEPRFSDETVAGNPALIVRPAGEGPWPAVFFVNGTVPEGRKLPEARRLAEGFARAGYLVVLPDLPGLTQDRITPKTVAETAEAARDISEHRDAADDRVALVGVSTGSTLALLAAGEPGIRDRVSVVAGVAPYSDIKNVVNVATTGSYEGGNGDFVRHRADPFLSYVVARSLVGALPPGDDRQTLSSEIENVGREHPNPLGGLRLRRTEDLGPGARDVVALLANRDPNRFADLYAALPGGVKKDLEAISPLASPGRIEAPVELATSPQDKYFPASESRNLGGIAPDLRVTVTSAIDHAELDSSGEGRHLAGFNAFVVRSLRDARVG